MFARYKPYTALNNLDVEFIADGGQLPAEVDTHPWLLRERAQILKRFNNEEE